MRTLQRVLIVVQMLGVIVTAALAVWDIETIIGSGPIMSSLGLFTAAVCHRKRFVAGFYYGLLAPTVSVLCLAIIYGLQLGPSDAQAPISILIGVSSLFNLGVGLLAFVLSFVEGDLKVTGRFQFRIIDIMALMLALSILLAGVQTGVEMLGALGMLISYMIAIALCILRFHGDRGAQPQPLPVEAKWA